MSDILEDQKIHYIVKDYRRMYNEHNELVAELKKLHSELQHKDNRIRDLEKQVEGLKKAPTPSTPKPSGAVRGAMNEIEARSNSVANQLRKSIESLNGIVKNVEELRVLINP